MHEAVSIHGCTGERAHDAEYHAACKRNNEDDLNDKELSDRLTVLSVCIFLTIFSSEVDRFIQLACVTNVIESADGSQNCSYDSSGASASEAADTEEHCWREEEAECDADKEAGVNHVDDGGELVNLGPFGALKRVGVDSTARIVG